MHKIKILNSQDVLLFPKEIAYIKYKSYHLAIAIETANWILLETLFQKEILLNLIQGVSIGRVILSTSSNHKRKQIYNLLTQISAREFAYTEKIPVPKNQAISKFLNIYLTNECNLRCIHCYMNSGIKLKNELPIDAWLKILSDFKLLGGEHLTITGGEPLMNKDFERILIHSAKIGIKNTVLTNGTLWEDELIDKLSPFITEIQISIDGVDESSNSIIRGCGQYDKAIKTIISFANKGIRTSVATTFLFENLSFANSYQEFMNEIKKQTTHPIFFKLSKKVLKGRNIQYDDFTNNIFYTKIKDLEEHLDSKAVLQNFIIDHIPNKTFKNCGFGGLSITANGEVFLCNRISEIKSYGNVKDYSLNYFVEIGTKINEITSVNHVKPCLNCELKHICGGGCRIDDYNFKGILYKKDMDLNQIKCNNQYKDALLNKMVESYKLCYNL